MGNLNSLESLFDFARIVRAHVLAMHAGTKEILKTLSSVRCTLSLGRITLHPFGVFIQYDQCSVILMARRIFVIENLMVGRQNVTETGGLR